MDVVTQNLGNYVREKGINVAKMSRDTGIPYVSLYRSLLQSNSAREIRGSELLKCCAFLGINPVELSGERGSR